MDEDTQAAAAKFEEIKAQVPDGVRKALGEFVSGYGKGDPAVTLEIAATVKALFWRKLQIPAVQAQGDRKWETACRAALSEFMGLMASQAFDFDFLPIQVSDRPMEPRVDPKLPANDPRQPKDFRIRAFGLAACADARSLFEGPATLMVYGFGSRDTAARTAAQLVPGQLYRVRAKIGTKSPRGRMEKGNIGNITGNADDPIRAIAAPNGGLWPDVLARLREVIPLSPIADLLTKPTQYGTYRIEGEVTRGHHTASRDRMIGILTVADDSVITNPKLAELSKGGLSIFLSATDVPKARLAPGSKVEAIVGGYETDEKNQQGERTGNKVWRWSASLVRVVLDLTPSTEVPDPGKPLVTVPSAAPAAPTGPGSQRDII